MSQPLTCDFKHPEFCNGKDVRAVFQRRIVDGRNLFDGPTRHWCQGCRELNRGGFKYADKPNRKAK